MKPRLVISLGLGLAALAACEDYGQQTRVPTAAPAPPVVASEQSQALSQYYSNLQADLLARGLMRTDGGGPDTPFTPDMLARNFERIAFYDEYTRGAGLERASGPAGQLRRWSGPVRVNIEFGPTVSASIQQTDRATLQSYIPRLASATGHSISATANRPNFHVLVMGADDGATVESRVRQIVPNVGTSTLNLFRDLPRDIHCLVVAFASEANAYDYTTAIALVRAEHPDLLRKSCLHEEIAQGLGLANDSPQARPSIFNDDDEFALLTTHDEMLLSMLYDNRLTIGMSAEAARPIIRTLAREQTGQIY